MLKRLLPLALVLVLGLTACGGEAPTAPAPAPTPTPAVTAAPTSVFFALPRTGGSLHPILSRDRVNLTLAPLLWEGLFALDAAFTPQPVLCQSYTVSEDGLTWSFTLRTGVTFSDGSPLTAGDAAASLLLAKGADSRFAQRLAGVRTVQAQDGLLVLTLSAPNGGLPALLDVPIVRGESEQPLGTGPYLLEGSGDDSRLTARPDWWQGKPRPAEVIPLRTLPEADDLISAFDTGDIALVTGDLTGTSAVGYGGSYETWDYPTTGMVYVGFQCAGKSPCADPALRRALARGLDRSTVASSLYAWHAQAAALPVSPVSPLYDPAAAAALSYSPQALAALLGEAGYIKNDDGALVKGRAVLSLDFVVNTDNSFRLAAAEYLCAELGRAGVQVNLRKLPWADYVKALETGDFDLYLAETLLSPDFDLAPLLTAGGTLNHGRYANAETAALLTALRAADDAGRKAAAAALYARLAQEVPFAPVCFKNQSVLTQWGSVSGLSPTQQNPFYGMEQWTIRSPQKR